MTTNTLWRWYPAKDDWEYVTQANADKRQAVLRGHKRRDVKGARYKWTIGYKPKKFRTREKRNG